MSTLHLFSTCWSHVLITDVLYFRAMNISEVQALGIHMLPGYSDPYHGRPLTKGELGCFLSHYNIWKEVNLRRKVYEHLWIGQMGDLLVNLCLALDCGTRPGHLPGDWRRPALWDLLQTPLDEPDEGGGGRRTGLGSHVSLWLLHNWFDLCSPALSIPSHSSSLFLSSSYIGRKRMQIDHPEKAVPNIHNLVEADYSYWTLGYMISSQGAMKLLRAEPLKRILPVDEFLPIMFNKHPV